MHTLLKGLEKIAASADIPMLVAGDFNSVPGSAAHALLVKRSVDPNHPVRWTCLVEGLACNWGAIMHTVWQSQSIWKCVAWKISPFQIIPRSPATKKVELPKLHTLTTRWPP